MDELKCCSEGAEEKDQKGKGLKPEQDGGKAATKQHHWSLKGPKNHLRPQTRGQTLGLFFNRFDQVSTPPPAVSSLQEPPFHELIEL